MSAIIRDIFRVNTLSSFINSLATQSLYLGIARPEYWDTVSSNDVTIPIPDNTVASVNLDWEDMLALKKITISDAIAAIYKEMWQANVKYDTYRHDWNGSRPIVYNGPNIAPTLPTSIGDVKCVVITDTFGIYICLKQPIVNGIVQPSIYSPKTGTPVGSAGVVKTADGYYWKFIAVTSPADLVKFSSTYYHPIETVLTAPAPSDPYYPQWTSQVTSALFKGGIYTINVTSAGTGYHGNVAGVVTVTDSINDGNFKVIGNGIGLQYTVTYGASGSIMDVEITNPGHGYTYATITAVGGTGASFDIVYTPLTGLGVSPDRDIVARYMIIDTSLTGAEGNGVFTVSNDFRKLMLIINPYNFGTSTIATSAFLDASYTINVGVGLSAAAYPYDSIVTGSSSGAKGRIVDFNTVTGNIRIIRTSYENIGNIGSSNSFIVGETLNTNPGTGTASIVSITSPGVEKYSGDILYSEYRSPIFRSVSQTEDLKIIVKF